MGDCLKTVFSWTMAKMDWRQFTTPAGSTAGTEACMTITWCMGGRGSFRVPGLWCWAPQLPQRHFCPQTDAEFWWMEGLPWCMSFSGVLLMSVLFNFWGQSCLFAQLRKGEFPFEPWQMWQTLPSLHCGVEDVRIYQLYHLGSQWANWASPPLLNDY